MAPDDFDRALGLIREQGKAQLTGLVRLLVRNGYCRSEVSAVFAYIGEGLSDEAVGQQTDWQSGVRWGRLERRRGTFEEFYERPRYERITR